MTRSLSAYQGSQIDCQRKVLVVERRSIKCFVRQNVVVKMVVVKMVVVEMSLPHIHRMVGLVIYVRENLITLVRKSFRTYFSLVEKISRKNLT